MMAAAREASAGPILLIGKSGQVGWELERTLAPLAPVVAAGRAEIDLVDADSIRRRIRDVDPCLIVNAAAYTAVDAAESEPEVALAVNGKAPGVLAEEARRLGIPLVHYSTDYVFDGRPRRGPDGKIRPYVETDKVGPINEYGHSKLAGERAIQAVAPVHLIFRTSWIYGARGRNFLRTIQRLSAEREELRVVSDQIGSPTWARMIAEATAQVLAATWRDSESGNLAEKGGLYHLSAAGLTSWYGFAEAIFAVSQAAGNRIPRLKPIATDAYPLPAKRPGYSVLDSRALTETFGISLPPWQHQLRLCLASAIPLRSESH